MTLGMPSVYACTQCKVPHCGKRVGEAKSGEKETRREQLCMEVDREMLEQEETYQRTAQKDMYGAWK